MNLPKNGRIVVVDDEPEEALPLIQALSKLGCPVSFFSEREEELPENPILGIRVLFLDMVLIKGSESDTNIISGAFKSVLGKILSDGNGPFLPIAWTNQPTYVKELKTYLDGRGFHFPIISLVKSECKPVKGEGFSLDLINSAIDREIVGNESLDFFTCWENIAHDSALTTVNQIAQLKVFSDSWNDEMKSIILKLARSYVGKQLDKTKSCEVIANSLFSLNVAFADNLHASILKDEDLKNIDLDFNALRETDDPDTSGIINSRLNLDLTEIDDPKPMPGNVYSLHCAQEVCLFELFKQNEKITYDLVKKDLKEKSKHIVLESTPACDYAQKKWKASRLLPGVLWPFEFSKHIKNAQYVYCSPVIRYVDNKLYHLVVDFRLFTSTPIDNIDSSKYLFRIKQELLADVQSHLSSHVSRPGIISLD